MPEDGPIIGKGATIAQQCHRMERAFMIGCGHEYPCRRRLSQTVWSLELDFVSSISHERNPIVPWKYCTSQPVANIVRQILEFEQFFGPNLDKNKCGTGTEQLDVYIL